MNHPIYFRKAYISLGANLAFAGRSPQQNIKRALSEMDCADLQLVRASSIWSSPAWPNPSDPKFSNAVALFMCHLTPLRLLNQLARIEQKFGRQSSKRNAPRSLDLDLISYGNLQMATKRVELPHPRLQDRAFVLLPLREVEPAWKHPVFGKNVTQLLAKLSSTKLQSTQVLG